MPRPSAGVKATNPQAHSASFIPFSHIKAYTNFLFLSSFNSPSSHAVSLVGFGSFGTSVRSARTARNPRTGEPIQVPETTVATFAPSKVLKDKVNTIRALSFSLSFLL